MPITWKSLGYSYANNASVANSLAAVAVKGETDRTVTRAAVDFPNNCNIQSVEVYMTGFGGSPTELTMYLARDSDGDIAITPGGTTGATQTINIKTAGEGSCVFNVDSDFHFDGVPANTTEGTIYAVMKLDSGSATADVRVNWRA